MSQFRMDPHLGIGIEMSVQITIILIIVKDADEVASDLGKVNVTTIVGKDGI